MHKSYKQIRLTFPFLSLLALLVISLVLFATQSAFAQDSSELKNRSEVAPVEMPDTFVSPHIDTEPTVKQRSPESMPTPVPDRMPPQTEPALNGTGTSVSTPSQTSSDERTDADNIVVSDIQSTTPRTTSTPTPLLTTGVERDESKRVEIEALRTERTRALGAKRAAIEARKAAQNVVLPEETRTEISTASHKLITNLTAANDRLLNLANRLRTHAESLQTRGIDTEATLASLDRAQLLLEKVQVSLQGTDVDIEYVVTSPEPRADWMMTRTQFAALRDMDKEAHALLKEVVATLKSMMTQEATAPQE